MSKVIIILCIIIWIIIGIIDFYQQKKNMVPDWAMHWMEYITIMFLLFGWLFVI